MKRTNKKELGITVIVTSAILFAYLLRLPLFSSIYGNSITRSLIYTSLYILWGVSLYRRLNNKQVRRYMVLIAGLMVFWFFVRIIKFSFTDALPELKRYTWYLYYLPMLFIPLLAVLVALSIGTPENSILPKKTGLLYIPAAILFTLVITNDVHCLVFTFPEEAKVWTDSDYGYGIGYYFIVAYLLLCALGTLATMCIKCRLPGSRRRVLLPCLPILIMLIYMVLNYLRIDWLYYFAGDMTAVFCLMYAAALELCIHCGLIRTNSGYDDLFRACTFGAQIVDDENRTRYSSLNAPVLTPDLMCEAEKAPVLLDKNTLVKSNKIPGGHVFWKEDITEVTAVIEELEEACRELSERNYLAQENYDTQRRISALKEKNRLLDLLQQQTKPQIDLLDKLLEKYKSEASEAERRRLLAMSAVVGSYIKRCGNLLFIGESEENTDIKELVRCLDESFSNLELLGVSCGQNLPGGITVRSSDALKAYNIFETITEAAMESLASVWIKGIDAGTEIKLKIEAECDADLSSLSGLADGFSHEDGAYSFTFSMKKGGDKL